MRKLWRALLALLLIALLVVGGPWALVQVLSFGRTWTSADEAPSNDVGLVMGAATLNGRPSGYLKARLDLALQLWEQGKIKPRVTESFALADGGKAIAKLGDRTAVGKLVVTI